MGRSPVGSSGGAGPMCTDVIHCREVGVVGRCPGPRLGTMEGSPVPPARMGQDEVCEGGDTELIEKDGAGRAAGGGRDFVCSAFRVNSTSNVFGETNAKGISGV